MKSRIALAALLLVFLSTSAKAFEAVAVISGVADARDGDDITFGSISVRLQGIAAPEDRRGAVEPGGPESTESLRQLVQGRYVICHLDGTATRNRPVGVCFVGLQDVGEYQVLQGMARDCPAFSGGRYAEAERQAREAGRDLSSIYPLPGYC